MTFTSRTPRLAGALVVLLGCLVLLPASPVRAQEEDPGPARRKAILAGTHVFRRILHDQHLEPIETYRDFQQEEPQRCILIVLGDLDEIARIKNQGDWLKKFVEAGGAVLAASDRTPDATVAREQLAAVAGVKISSDTFSCRNRDNCYNAFPFCPILVPVDGAQLALFQPPLPLAVTDENPFAALLPLMVATNVPSCLIPVSRFPGKVRRLAMLPDGMVRRYQPRQPLDDPLFAVGGDVGEGRVLVLADHSLFINEMMLPTDNNNVEFTANCVTWLRGGDQRDRVLFIEDGKIQPTFNIPLKTPNLPLEEVFKMIFARRNELLVEFEKGAARLEDDDFFNRKVLEFLHNHGWPLHRLIRYFAGFTTLALLLYGIWRLGVRQRFRHDTSAPLLATEVGRTLPVGPLLAQRAEALVARGNLWEPAALLVRRWFARVGVEGDAAEPLFTVQGSWWQRRRLLARLRRLWRLADGRQPERVTAPRMWGLQRELDELRAARERGVWGVARTPTDP